MHSSSKRGALKSGVAALALLAASAAQAQVRSFDVPSENAVNAIPEFARQAGVQILVPADALAGVKTPAIHGNIDLHEALHQLLAGTGFTIASDDGQTIALAAPPKNAQAAPNEGAVLPAEAVTVETITVTAEKRSETSLNVPMSLTALSGDQLARAHDFSFQDYVGTVPGLTLMPASGPEGTQLIIRGLSTGQASVNAPVAAYIDETPYIGAGPFAGGIFGAPDLDTYDMQRIEVLRGPQGTLYGANALGGLLKFVTNAPDPSGFGASVESGVSSVYNGGVGFDVHGMINVPLSSDAALRVVGYDNYYPGFIDDPSRGLKDINGSHYTGGRASILYEPTADFSIRFSALFQDRSWSDFSNEDVNPVTLSPLHGDLTQENLISQPGSSITQVYNLTENWDVGFAKILSTTSYSAFELNSMNNFSKSYGALLSPDFAAITPQYGSSYGVAVKDDRFARNFTQELRVSSEEDEPLQWLAGAYYTNQTGQEFEPFYPVDATNRTILFNYPADLLTARVPVGYREYAGFANVDYHVTPTFDAALGGRYSYNTQSFYESETGLLNGGGTTAFGNHSQQGVFTYSGDLRWHVTPENMLYARIASGYVPGGPNDAVPTAPVPKSYNSSTDVNYEVGVKSSLLDQSLTIEVSAFDIVWHDIQLAAIINGFGTVANGGSAQSKGGEWNIQYVPIAGLTLGFNGAYTDAYLTQDTPASVGGLVGQNLPGVPLWQASASAEYERPLFGDYSGFVAGDWRYLDARYADFFPVATGPRQEMPGFSVFDLRAGVETSQWSLTLYAKNVGNALGLTYVVPETLADGSGPQSATVYTPRTIGITATAKF